jgi:integrase
VDHDWASWVTLDTRHRTARGATPVRAKGGRAKTLQLRVTDIKAKRSLRNLLTDSCANTLPTTVNRENAVERYIKAELGHHRISDLTRADVAQFHHQCREHPHQANRCLAVLSKMMNLAEAWGLRPDGANPCRHVKKYREEKRERYLTNEELQRVGVAMSDAGRTNTESPFALAAIGLLILTGARVTEILTLRWEYVDFGNAVLRLPDSKTGAKLIYLNDAAIKMLRDMPRIAGNPFVIAGGKPGTRLVNLQKPWRRLRTVAKIGDCRLHDLRHTYASFGASAGMSLPVIGKLLGHSQAATTQRYVHLGADPVRAAANEVGKLIGAAMETRPRRVRPRLNPAVGQRA